MPNRKLQTRIRDICTYHSEDGEGTSGYSLSEKQFQELFSLIDQSESPDSGMPQLVAIIEQVISEDEKFSGISPHPMLPPMGNPFWHERNELRAEQRKRLKELIEKGR